MTEIVPVFFVIQAQDSVRITSIKKQSNSTFGGRVARACRHRARALILGRNLRKPPRSAVSTVSNNYFSIIIFCFVNVKNSPIIRKNVGDGVGPFDNDDVSRVGEIFAEIFDHEAGVGETIEVVVNEAATTR